MASERRILSDNNGNCVLKKSKSVSCQKVRGQNLGSGTKFCPHFVPSFQPIHRKEQDAGDKVVP